MKEPCVVQVAHRTQAASHTCLGNRVLCRAARRVMQTGRERPSTMKVKELRHTCDLGHSDAGLGGGVQVDVIRADTSCEGQLELLRLLDALWSPAQVYRLLASV